MRCDEIQERLIELLYDEPGMASADFSLREHVNSCAACRKELEELQGTRRILNLWKNENPLNSAEILRAAKASHGAFGTAWQMARIGAIAALVFLGILALANTRLAWNDQGFSFSTRLFSGGNSPADYYTRAEVREIVRRSLDDSEARMYETNSLMIQEALDTMEKEQYAFFRLAGSKGNQRRNVN
jgi:hypothetical protein